MADQQKVAYGLSNDAIFNDLERPLTQFPRSDALMLNSSQTAIDTAIVTIEGEQETAPKLSNGTSFSYGSLMVIENAIKCLGTVSYSHSIVLWTEYPFHIPFPLNAFASRSRCLRCLHHPAGAGVSHLNSFRHRCYTLLTSLMIQVSTLYHYTMTQLFFNI